MVLKENQGIKVNNLRPLGTMNVCTECHGKTSNNSR